MSNNNQNLIASFIAGAAAGALTGYYLNSDAGRVKVNQAKEKADELASQVADRAHETRAQVNDTIQQQVTHLQSQIAQMQASLSHQVETGKAFAADKMITSLESTIQAAEKLKSRAEDVKVTRSAKAKVADMNGGSTK